MHEQVRKCVCVQAYPPWLRRAQGRDGHFTLLICDVPDNDVAAQRSPETVRAMHACWDAAALTVEAAAASGGRVLLQLQGRTRSAACAIAVIMHVTRTSARAACEVVCTRMRSVQLNPALLDLDLLEGREGRVIAAAGGLPALGPGRAPPQLLTL